MDKHKIGIYCIRNIINGMIYVGQSVEMEKRFKRHRNSLSCGKHHNDFLQRAWNKHGPDAFEFEILEECQESELNEKEYYYIEEVFKSRDYKNGYNGREAGSNGRHSEESRRKMSESTKGQICKEETRKKFSAMYSGSGNPMFGRKGELAPMFGKCLSEETKLKISINRKGIPVLPATRKKISESLMGKLIGEKNPFYGCHHSEEQKWRWSETRIGIHPSEESRRKMSISRTGLKMSEEARKNISQSKLGDKNPFYGKSHSEETKQRWSISRRKYDQETVSAIRLDISSGLKNKDIQEKHNITKSTLRKIKFHIKPYS